MWPADFCWDIAGYDCDADPADPCGQDETCRDRDSDGDAGDPDDCDEGRGGNSVNVVTGSAGFSSRRADATVVSPVGQLHLSRRYASYAALNDDGERDGDQAPGAMRLWGTGWYHEYEWRLRVTNRVTYAGGQCIPMLPETDPSYCLYVREHFEEVDLERPDGTKEQFAAGAGKRPGLYHPSINLEATASGWNLYPGDGRILTFEPWGTGNQVARLARIDEANGDVVTLTYYDASAATPCDDGAAPRAGKLCLVSSDAGTIHFASYDGPGGRLSTVTYGSSSDVALHTRRTTYSYTEIPRQDASGQPSSVSDDVVLTSVTHDELDGTWETYDSETYSYTDESYYRPDLPVAYGFDQRQVIVAEFADSGQYLDASVHLLQRVTDHGGRLVQGNGYHSSGQAAADLSPGQALVFLYENLVTEHRTTVIDESKGNSTEYVVQNGRITDIESPCGCSGDAGRFEHVGDLVVRRWAIDPNGGPNGMLTGFDYNANNMPYCIVDNYWDPSGQPDCIAITRDDIVNNQARMTWSAYGLADAPQTVTARTPKFSVLCPDDGSYGLSCPGSFLIPATIFDYDTDYDSAWNDAPGSRLTQRVERGLTLTDAASGTVEQRSKTTQTFYDGTENRVSEIVYFDGSSSEYSLEYEYYSPAAGGFDADRLRYVRLNGTTIQEHGGYDAEDRPGWTIDERGVQTDFIYDRDGRLTSRTVNADDPLDTRTTTYVYDASGKLASTYSSDARGTGWVRSDNVYDTPAGLPGLDDPDFCNTQESGLTDQEVIDRQQQCIEGLAYLDQPRTTEVGVDMTGTLSVTRSATVALTPAGLVSTSEVRDGGDTLHQKNGREYDSLGNLQRLFKFTGDDAAAAFVRDLYPDALGRVTAVADENHADVASSHEQNGTAANEGRDYDALGRLTAVRTGIGSAEATETRYEYDFRDNLIQVSVGLLGAPQEDLVVTRYQYDDFDQLVLVDSPDSGQTRYVYDDAGNLVTRLEANGDTTSYTYESAGGRGRLLSAARSGSVSGTYAEYFYDQIDPAFSDAVTGAQCGHIAFDPREDTLPGRLAWVRHPAGATYYSYNEFGETIAVYEQIGPYFEICSLQVTRYTYDGSGRLASMTLPSGRTLTYVYGPGGLYPASVEVSTSTGALLFGGDLLDSATYLPGGELAGYSMGAVTFSGAWDYAGQATARAYATPISAGLSWDIDVRDGVGNIERLADTGTGRELDVTYDEQYRVDSAVGTGLRGYQNCTELSYDGAGNRTSDTCEGTTITYGYETGAGGEATNRLASISWDVGGTCARAIERDDNGRAETGYSRKFPSSSDRLSMTYGADGRLSSVSVDGGPLLASFAYDHRSLRLVKATDTASHAYTYDTSGRLIAEQGPEGVKEYVYLNGTLVAMMSSSGAGASEEPVVYAVGVDHLGTPMRAWERTTGVAAWAADYEVFGRAHEYLPSSSALPDVGISLRFPGQYEDAETGLHYNWHRYYDPDTGRYLSEEPVLTSHIGADIAASSGRMLPAYSYSLNSPLAYVDVNGFSPSYYLPGGGLTYGVAPLPSSPAAPASGLSPAAAAGAGLAALHDLFCYLAGSCGDGPGDDPEPDAPTQPHPEPSPAPEPAPGPGPKCEPDSGDPYEPCVITHVTAESCAYYCRESNKRFLCNKPGLCMAILDKRSLGVMPNCRPWE